VTKIAQVGNLVGTILKEPVERLRAMEAQREEEIDEAMEAQAEQKYMAVQPVKKKFKVSIAMAQKSGDEAKLKELQE
jgi:hypothetical protein